MISQGLCFYHADWWDCLWKYIVWAKVDCIYVSFFSLFIKIQINELVFHVLLYSWPPWKPSRWGRRSDRHMLSYWLWGFRGKPSAFLPTWMGMKAKCSHAIPPALQGCDGQHCTAGLHVDSNSESDFKTSKRLHSSAQHICCRCCCLH